MVSDSIIPEAIQEEWEQPVEEGVASENPDPDPMAGQLSAMQAQLASTQKEIRGVQGFNDKAATALRLELTSKIALLESAVGQMVDAQQMGALLEEAPEDLRPWAQKFMKAVTPKVQPAPPAPSPEAPAQADGVTTEWFQGVMAQVQAAGYDPQDQRLLPGYQALINGDSGTFMRTLREIALADSAKGTSATAPGSQRPTQTVNPSVNQSPAATGAGNPDDIRAQFISNKIPKDIYIQKMIAIGEEP
jgi:hypothetical protein